MRREPDYLDGRVTRLALTETGRSVLAKLESDNSSADPVQLLPRAGVADANTALSTLLRHWQQGTCAATFGACRSCACFQVEASGRFRCSVTAEPLNRFDSGRICHVHPLSGK